MNEEMQNMRDLLQLAFKKWYYFVITAVVVGFLGGMYYLTTPKSYNTSLLYHFCEDEQGRMFYSHENAMQRTLLARGYDIRVTDEQERVNSHDIMREVVLHNGLQTEVRKKQNLRYEGVWPCYELSAQLLDICASDLVKDVEIKVKKQQNSLRVKAKVGKQSQKYTVSLDEPIITLPDYGRLQINDNGLADGAVYKLTIRPVNALVDDFCSSIMSDRCSEDNHIMEIFACTDMPVRTQFIMHQMLEEYSRIITEERKQMAAQAAVYIDERIDSTAAEIAALQKNNTLSADTKQVQTQSLRDEMKQLIGRKNDLTFAQVYSLQPVRILDNAHTNVKPAGPRLMNIALIILLLSVCIPCIVLYIESVFRSE